MSTYHQFTQQERYMISAQMMCGTTQAEIVRLLGRHRSKIGRELRRNVTTHVGGYRAEKAHSYATAWRRRCRRGAQFSAEDMARVAAPVRRRWSAEQISGVSRKKGVLRISHETIYRRIRWDKKSVEDLWRYTRIMSKFGRERYLGQSSRGVLPGKWSIGELPLEVQGRRRIGHCEGDTVMGSDMRHRVLTLVERKPGYAIIKKLRAHKKDKATRAATRAIRSHCRKFKTITFGNGTEFHDYAVLEQRFPVKVYFATPYHSWERGSNENFNGLVRQYLPKGACMSTVTQAQSDHIADDVNNRPRKHLGPSTPAALYHRR